MKLLRLFNMLLCATAWLGGLVTVFAGFASAASGTAALAFLPFLYGFFATMLFFCSRVWESQNRFTVYAVLILQWVRCVFMPTFGMLSGAYTEVMAGDYFSAAILLMVIELAVTAFVCLFLLRNGIKAPKIGENALTLRGDYGMYVLFGLGALALYLMFARGEKLFSFMVIDTASDSRVGDEIKSSHMMIRTIVTSAMTFLSLCVIYRSYERFTATKRKRHLYLAMLMACLMLCIIIGERRSRQLYLLFSYSFLLCSLFPKYKKRLLFSLVAVGGTVLVFMSIYKFFYAFLYDSYGEAIAKANNSLADTVSTYDSYFFGIKIMVRNLNYGAHANLSLRQLLFDVGRNIFGVHYLFKGGHTTSELYNLYLYGGQQASGHLMSASGYGYMFFGYLAPLMTGVNILVAAFLERQLSRAKTVEWTYTLSAMFMRVTFGMFCCFPPLLNSLSQTVVINGIVIFCASVFRKTRQRQSIYRR